ncbi:MAG: multiheme c-type cytochrome [Fuerstiella sp.]|nr:multiheme c-type cytochrome [Fuerstiella sp.]
MKRASLSLSRSRTSAIAGVMFTAAYFLVAVSTTSAAEPATGAAATDVTAKVTDHSRVMGAARADCKKCHVSEVAAGMKTVHFQSAEQRLYKFDGNTKKYADALGIKQAELLSNSACADCHGTVALEAGQKKVVSGVSCESCHGAAGGDDGWLNTHQSYHASMKIPREQETAEHKAERHARCDTAGMVRSTNLYGLAKSCYGCHLIGNEKLVAAGHKAASVFDFVSWSTGEVRHNFFMDKEVNAAAPSLWTETEKGTVANRRRMKFVVGMFAQVETTLRLLAPATEGAVIKQFRNPLRDAAELLQEVDTPETVAVGELVEDFVPSRTGKKPENGDEYLAAADEIAEHAKAFVNANDGSKFADLDEIIEETPAYYSQQYKQKYGEEN